MAARRRWTRSSGISCRRSLRAQCARVYETSHWRVYHRRRREGNGNAMLKVVRGAAGQAMRHLVYSILDVVWTLARHVVWDDVTPCRALRVGGDLVALAILLSPL